jgi:hypothetical protein
MKLPKIPIDKEFYVVIFLFLVVIFISVFGNTAQITPYQTSTSLSHSRYEGFAERFPENVNNAANVSGQEESAKTGTKGVLGIFETAKIQAGPIDPISIYDPVSKLKGSSSCVGQSMYSNSVGGLCITKDAQAVFDSRGGNFV